MDISDGKKFYNTGHRSLISETLKMSVDYVSAYLVAVGVVVAKEN